MISHPDLAALVGSELSALSRWLKQTNGGLPS
ncbi:hypothetical protein BN440_2641 [Erwinia amylovora MR1]|nr:hypothetical protein BN440_2641 [Erwinia amylovora MR1]